MKTALLRCFAFLVLLSLTSRAQTSAKTLDYGGEANNNVGEYTSQAIVNGKPAICYLDGTNGDIIYVRALDANGASWGPPKIVANEYVSYATTKLSLAVINGNPAISYVSIGVDCILKYVRALDANGTYWDTPVTVTGAEFLFSPSLTAVNGNPAISYNAAHYSRHNLQYVRALDTSGESWGAPVSVDPVSAGTPSLVVINGNPAISYYDWTNGDLRYVRATDASGANWATPLTLDSTGDVGFNSSLAVIASNPAICYYDQTNGDLKYLRALDMDGTSWGASITLDSTGIVGTFASLAIINGSPAISYYDTTSRDLKYVRALDTSGTIWNTPQTLDSIGNVGQYTSLVSLNGSPAISYYDATNGDLKWATIAVTPMPEIAVVQGSALTDGVSSVSFGAVAEGNTADLVFTIYNTGTVDLTGLGITIDGADADNFSVTASPVAPVSGPNGSTTFTVHFAPNTPGQKNAALHIASNDADEVSFDIALAGAYALISQSISFTNPGAHTFGDPPFALNATGGGSGNPVTYSIVSGPATLSGTTLTITGAGSVTVRASQAGNGFYLAAADVEQTFTAAKANQTIYFTNPGPHTFGDAPLALNATGGGSGIPVTYSIVSGPATISGNTLTLTGVGSVTVRASQAGNPNYFAAADVEQTFTVAALQFSAKTLDSGGGANDNVGEDNSQSIVNGCPAISYYDHTNFRLKYVRALDASGTNWGAPKTLGGMGKYTSLIVVNGNPAIFNFHVEGITFLRALDPNGDTWGAAVEVDGGPHLTPNDSTLSVSCAIVNGNPAVCYYFKTGYESGLPRTSLRYIRAADPNGTNWGAPVILAEGGTTGDNFVTMAVVNGNPAIYYNGGTSSGYRRALDAYGTNWGPIVNVNAGQYPSMKVIAGNPAISCYNNGLKFVRALDASGTNWGAPVSVVASGAQYTSLAVIGGNPAISYSGNGVKYIRALDTSGTSWGAPVTFDNNGIFTSLVSLINGKPAISYYDAANGDLKWATVPSTPEPEIEVAQGNLLTDGVSSVSFGYVAIGNTADFVFTIRNIGTADLTGLEITFDGADASDFSVTASPVAPVPGSSASTTFTVHFAPTTPGQKYATLHIASNDADEASFDIGLTGIYALLPQSISFTNPGAHTFGDAPFALSATGGGSGNPVIFSIVSGPATVNGNMLTITGLGSVTVRASQAGNASYHTAADVEQTFIVAKPTQTISFTNPGAHTFGDAAFLLNASGGGSGNPVTFSIVSGPATVSGNTLTITGAGSVTVRASQAGNGAYLPAVDVEQTFTVAKANQTISFTNPGPKVFGNPPFTLSAIGGASGNPVTFSIVSGPATLSGNTLTMTGAGSVTARASQAGNANYLAAADVEQTFTVAKASQTIGFTNLGAHTFGGAAFLLNASGGGSGNPVTFSIVSGPATVTGNTLTLTGAGGVTVRASQAGNANYLAAADVEQTFTVAKASQTIGFTNPGAHTFGDAPFALNATGGGSGNPETFSIVSGPATVTGNTVTLTGAGGVTVRASQAGNANYLAAADVEQTFTVAKASQTINFTNPGAHLVSDAPFTLVVSGGGSGNPVVFSIVTGAATVSGNTLTLTGTGGVTVRASQSGNTNYFAAADVEQTFSVGKGIQTITFTNPGTHTFGDAPFTLNATGGGSGNPVVFSILSGPATVSGNTLTITGAGVVTVLAVQSSNSNYLLGVTEQFFTVEKAAQAIAFNPPANAVQAATVTLDASGGGSGNAVTFSVLSGPGSLVGNTLSFTAAGEVVIRASQTGNANYLDAPNVDQTINVRAGTVVVGARKYSGLLYNESGNSIAGIMRVNKNAQGSFTTSLNIGTQTARRIFTLDENNSARLATNVGTLDINVDESGHVAVRLDNGRETFTGNLHPCVLSATPQRLNIALESIEPSFIPGGGIMCAKITKTGAITFTGTLPDGKDFSGSTNLTDEYNFAIYELVPRTASRATVGGEFEIADLLDTDVRGELTWLKPPQASTKGIHAEGVDTKLTAYGCRYARGMSLPAGTCTLSLTGGNLAADIVATVNASAGKPSPHNVSVPVWVVDKVTGTFSAKVKDPARAKRVDAVGIYLPKLNKAWGYFPGTNVGGRIQLSQP